MVAWARLALVMFCGCDRVLGLEGPGDAPIDVDCSTVTPDEDGDCVADADDNCPGVANREQLDERDEDGVGDACDPRDSTPGDSLYAFESFNDFAAASTAWRPVLGGSPDWQFQAGQVVRADAGVQDGMLQRAAPVPLEDFTIEVGFAFGAWGPDPFPQISAVIDGPFDAEGGHKCFMTTLDAPMGRNTIEVADSLGQGTAISNVLEPAPGETVVVTMRRELPDRLHCRFTIRGLTTVLGNVTRRSTSTWPTERHVAVYTRTAALTLRWVTIYESR